MVWTNTLKPQILTSKWLRHGTTWYDLTGCRDMRRLPAVPIRTRLNMQDVDKEIDF